MGNDVLWPAPRGETHVRYVDDREFTRLVLSRRKLERVGRPGQIRKRIRDVKTGETYEIALESDGADRVQRMPSRRNA